MQKPHLLSQCERYLSDLDTLQRNKVLNQIILDLDSNPELLSQKPLKIANKYRENNDLPAYKAKKKFSVFKFILKSFLIITLILGLIITFILWKFSPIIKVDAKNNHIVFLGGLVDINGRTGKFKVFDQVKVLPQKFQDEFKVNIPMDPSKDEVYIQFKTASFKLENADSMELKIDCTLDSTPGKNLIEDQNNTITIDFKQIEGSECRLAIPRDKKITLEGIDAQVTVMKPEFDLYADIKNGSINIYPNIEENYQYTLELENGFVDNFNQTKEKSFYEINIQVTNGSINNISE